MKIQTTKDIMVSKFQKKINRLELKIVELNIRFRVNKLISERQSKFTNILEKDYPEIRKNIKEKFLKEYGKSPKRKEFFTQEVKKIKNKASGQFLLPRLIKIFDLNNFEIKDVINKENGK